MKRKHRKRIDPIKSEKKHTATAIIIWTASAFAAVILAIIIGNSLGESAGKINTGNSVPAFSYTYEGTDVPPVKAPLFDLSNENIEASIDDLDASVSAVSIYLRKGSEAPVYTSAVSSAVLNSTGNADLPLIVDALHKEGIYISACFDAGSFSIENKIARDSAIAFEAAMIAEIAEAGVDDIIILGLPVTDAGIAYASELFKKVREIKSDAILGAGIDYRYIQSVNGAAALEDYSKFADFCAIDTSDAKNYGTSSEAVAKSLLYTFEVYPLRLLIGISGDADFQAQVAEINALGITNIQAYKYATVSVG